MPAHRVQTAWTRSGPGSGAEGGSQVTEEFFWLAEGIGAWVTTGLGRKRIDGGVMQVLVEGCRSVGDVWKWCFGGLIWR